jgi:hypothetical protein
VIFGAVLLALVSFLIIGTRLSNAGRLSASLQTLPSRSVEVRVWGAPLASDSSPVFQVDSVRALGAGLLIFLRQAPKSGPTLLKVAQPRAARVEGPAVEIGHAAYVQWDGRRLPRVPDLPAVRIQIRD